MKFMNPWENIDVQMMKSPSHIQSYDRCIHMIYVLSGEVNLRNEIANIILPVNGFFILPNSISCEVQFSSANCYEITLWNHFNDDLQYGYEFEGEFRLGGGPPDEELIRLLNQLLELYYLEKSTCSNVELLHLYFSLLYLLEKKYCKRKSLSKRENTKIDVQEIKYYIDNNYDREIHLSDLARQLFVSEQYLSRIFTKQIGTSISNYIQKKRLDKVEYELIYTSKSITNIVYGTGFDNINSFNRIFKRIYQKSPTLFRREHQKSIENTDNQKLDDQVIKLIKKNVVVKTDNKEIVIPVKSYVKRRKTEIIMNIQNPEVLLKKNYISHILQLQHGINIRNLRFFVTFSSQKTVHYYDEIIEMIISLKCIPFLSINPFEKDMDSNIHMFFMYFLQRYGKSVLNLWNIELLYTKDHSLSYAELQTLIKIQQICKRLIPNICIGIGGIPLVSDIEQKENIISCLKGYEDSFAFIGCYAKPSTKKGSVYQGKKSIYQFSKQNFLLNHMKELTIILKNYGIEKPLYLTEFGITPIKTDFLNDSAFIALFICKIHLQFNELFSMIGYCSCSDLDSDLQLESEEFFGSPGLFTQHGIPKSSYYAYQFLAELKDNTLYINENLIVTINSVGDIAILGYLYSEIDSAYCSNNEEIIHNQKLKALNTRLPVKFQMVFSDISDEIATYELTAEKIGVQNGNALDEWKKITSLTVLSKETVQYLMKKSIPMKYFKILSTKNGNLNLELYIEANQLVLLKLKRLN